MARQPLHQQGVETMFAALPAFNGSAARMMLWPIEAWLHLQSEVLNAAAPAAAEWIDRRREGTAAALQTIEKLTRCKDAQEASQIQSEWMREETKRLEADVRALGDQTLLLTRAAEKASRQGAQAAGAVA